jgi:pyridoxine 4-dehydrogenase
MVVTSSGSTSARSEPARAPAVRIVAIGGDALPRGRRRHGPRRPAGAKCVEGKIGAIGLSSVSPDILRRAIPAGIACVQNAYSLVARDDEDMLDLCAAEGIAWVPFFPLGGAMPGLPKVTDEPAVVAAARSLGSTPAQVGLAWLLHHAPNVLLIPGTANADHLQANVTAGTITLDNATLAALDAVPTRSGDMVLE